MGKAPKSEPSRNQPLEDFLNEDDIRAAHRRASCLRRTLARDTGAGPGQGRQDRRADRHVRASMPTSAAPARWSPRKMAVEDSGLRDKGWKIDVICGDHQNKPDVGVDIARQWIDVDKVDVIADTPNSGVALAIANLAKEKNGVILNSGAASSDLTGKACTPNTIHWTYDTYMLANGTGKALTKAGGDTWFFLTADYAFGARAGARHHRGRRRPTAARCSAASSIRSTRPTSPPSCCRRRPRRPRSSASPMPAATPPTRSSRRPNSASSRAARSSRRCCCSSTTCIRSASRPRRACTSPNPSTGT